MDKGKNDKGNKLFSRRRFLALTGGVIAAGAGLYTFVPGLRALPQQTADSAKAIAGHYLPIGEMDAAAVRQIITQDSRTSRTIMWQSELNEKSAFVEYRLSGSDSVTKLDAQEREFTDNNVTAYTHIAVLDKLDSGREYEYRIGYDDKRGDWLELKTDNGKSFKALIFPDSQSNDYTDWKNVAQFAAAHNPDAAFFVNMGDLVDNGEDHTQWKAWFGGVEGVIDRIPVAPVMGNHETYTMNWKVRMPKAYLEYFQLPGNGSAERQNQYYSFDYGDVHFVVLNTQGEEMEQFQPGLAEEQQAWFEADMAKTTKKWKVVLMHRDVLQYRIHKRPERKEGISDDGRIWMPLFDKYKVDIVFTAHLHTYRRRQRLYNFEPSDNGTLYILTGVSGNVRYPGLWIDHKFDDKIAPQPETDNYLTLEASNDLLKVEVFLPDGQKIDTAEVRK